MEEETVIVRNKLWMRLAIIIGLPVLGLLGLYQIWLAFQQAFDPLGQSLIFIAMGLFILFAVAKGVPLLRFLFHGLILYNDRVEIYKGNVSKILTWNQISEIKSSDTFQVLRIYDSSGKLVYAVDYYADNFYEFTEVLNEIFK